MIEFDVETTGLQPWSGVQYAFMFQFFDGKLLEVLRPENDEERIQWWFDRAKTEGIRAWNTKFDRAFADVMGFDLPPDGMWEDGMLLAHALNENRSIALKAVASELLGPDSDDLQKQVKEWLKNERARRKKEASDALSKEERKRRREGKIKIAYPLPTYADVPAELMEPYGAEDVILTRKVCDIMEPQIAQSKDLTAITQFEKQVLDALYAVEKRGFPVDDHGYRMLEHEVIDNLETLEEECDRLALEGGVEDFNPNSTAQIIKALKGRKADMSFMSEKNGKLSADRENLEAVDDELSAAILEFRSEAKVLSTYVLPYIQKSYVPAMAMEKEAFIGPDGRIHANYRQVGTKTGRMSCSDPNLQNQPRDDLRLRYNMRAEPGFKLVTCDLSNVEMRIFAAYAGKGKLLDALLNGDDIHELTAEMIGIRDRQRAGGTYESARQRGKTFNFSVVYGGGVRTIRKQQRVSQDEARLMLQRYKDAYPEVVRLQNRIAYKLQDSGFIRSAWGRRFHVDVRDSYKGVNYLVQGTAADLLKASLIRLHEEGVPVIACVHDEIIAHVPEAEAEATRDKIITALTDHPRITDKVPLEAEGDIVDRWSDAKALKDENGREYLFTPAWAGGEKRYLDELVAA
jgi:DNA polymerase-1